MTNRSCGACRGYGLRLSWPKASNSRRVVVGRSTLHNIEMHTYLSGLASNRSTQPILCPPIPFSSTQLQATEKYLLQYATAELQTLLALSSLQCDGLQSQAPELKISALRALTTTSNGNIGATQAAQHDATGMLLCSFEVNVSYISDQWRRYITGVKSVIKPPLIYWRQQTSPRPHSVPSPYNTTLNLLSEVFDTMSVKLLHTASDEGIDDYTLLRNNPSTTMAIKLLQLGMLVYFNRVSGNLLEPAAKADRRIKGAFTKLSQLGPCERQVPLFISDCEARTDGERRTMASSRSLFLVRKMIQAIWVQDDLANGAIDYMDKLSAIISCCAFLSTFV
ncbi:uncharacterized protein BDW43DRAFT_318323 [Aspergillus alliaceus]|uniref:uncharacterized protein n=1 Tax=Petromyces alliaceus TaxID=209559 RepID=UPI0012A6BFEE|nr:uncharacterized protein BDW43DRAFT_318323 [Aspergillus alliaceus]KAB8235393.1 hypothetical protein BDW43DRAFT_318323 [Aspergillus alliaceus]